jgi:hypothetical protein
MQKKRFWSVLIAMLLIISTLSCSFFDRLGDQTPRKWSTDLDGLKTLINDTIQGMSESDRIIQTVDRVELSENGGIKVYGPCPFSNSPNPGGDFGIALMTQDDRVRMDVWVGITCGIQQDDPRVAILSDRLSDALGEKIAVEDGKVLVDRVQLSSRGLTVWYIKPR